VALAGSSVVFAAVHRRRRATHVLTGAVFGGAYLATGALGAAIAAHWIYNALVALTAIPATGPAAARG
jgi:membrane protease YdiL (CAAX protease family)